MSGNHSVDGITANLKKKLGDASIPSGRTLLNVHCAMLTMQKRLDPRYRNQAVSI